MEQSKQVIQGNAVDYKEYKEGEEEESLPKIAEHEEKTNDQK